MMSILLEEIKDDSKNLQTSQSTSFEFPLKSSSNTHLVVICISENIIAPFYLLKNKLLFSDMNQTFF